MKKKIILPFIILFLFLIQLSFNCGKNDSDLKESNSKTSGYKIAGIVFQEDQFFKMVQIGMREAAKTQGVELLEGNSYNKPDKEIQLVNTYITNKVDAIVIAPLSATASIAALKRANEKGCKIIVHNNNMESDIVSAAIESDQRSLGIETGKAAAKYINAKMGGKANVAILAFVSLLPEQSNARSEGFKQEILKLPGVKIVAEQDAWLPEMAIKKTGDIITANPDVNIIFAANEGGTVGSVMSVKNSGKTGKIAVFGTDITNQIIEFLLSDDNILQAVTGQRAFDIGYKAIELSIKVLKNETFEKKNTFTRPALIKR
jgi:sugar transport system substrate-binding protein